MKKIILVLFLTIFCLSILGDEVINPNKPANGIWDLKMQKVWQIESAGEDVFAAITRMDLTNSGHLIVKDRRRFKLYIFDDKGKFIKSFGKRGEGPGEIKSMNGAGFYLADNLIIVPDRGRIHFYNEEGKFQKTAAISERIRPRTFVDKNTLISAPAASRDRSLGKEKIRIYNLNTQEEKVLTEYSPFKEATQSEESGGNQMIMAVVIGGLTPMMQIQYRDGILYYGMDDQYKVNMVDLKGKSKGSFAVEGRKRIKVSMDYKKNLFKRMGGDAPESMIQRMIKGLPEVATYFSRIVVDRNGFKYLFISNPEARYKQQIDIFSPQGKFLYSSIIELEKDKRIRSLCFKNDLIFLAIEDEEGDIKIVKYNISLPTK